MLPDTKVSFWELCERCTYEGRVKDMLKVGGENVAAAEIEGFLMQHEAVMLAQVASAPDTKCLVTCDSLPRGRCRPPRFGRLRCANRW